MKTGPTVTKSRAALSGQTLLVLLAFATGLLSGGAAVLLKSGIHGIQHLISTYSTSTARLYLILPGVGMLVSLLLVKYLVRDNIGHGVTRVLRAISQKESRIKGHNCWSSMLTSAITIGLGGSVGAEAPIVYTGAALGSNLASRLKLDYSQITLLLGCGAAGALAGTFKAPIAGVLFCMEILMFDLSMASLLPLMVSAITATVVSYLCLGPAVDFKATAEVFSLGNLPYYVGFGILCGFASLYFTRATLATEKTIKKMENPYLRWGVCAAGLGLLIYLFPPLFGEGYSSLAALLNEHMDVAVNSSLWNTEAAGGWGLPLFFLAVFFFKVLSMSFTNAGGGVGGTFGPTLFMGGVLGFVAARAVNLTGWHMLPEPNFALVGMAGLMAGVMQAPLTAIFLIAEITGGYGLLVPLIVTSIVSFLTIRNFETYSIYSKRLAQAGQLLTHDRDKAVLLLLKTSELIEKDLITIAPTATLGTLVHAVSASKRNIFPVVDTSGTFCGVVVLDNIRQIMFDTTRYKTVFVRDVMTPAPAFVYENEPMEQVMRKFDQSKAWNLPVLDAQNNYVGFISKSRIFSAYRNRLIQVSHE